MLQPIKRGVRILWEREPAASRKVKSIDRVEKVYLPLSYGGELQQAPGKLYETVTRETVLYRPDSPDKTPIICSVSGVFSGTQTIDHPVYGMLPCAVIDCLSLEGDGGSTPADLTALSPEDTVQIARSAGIIDEIDGVPLHLKLREWSRTPGCILVADAADTETFASSAWATLNTTGEQALRGLQLAAACVGACKSHIAVLLTGKRRRPLELRLGKENLFQVSDTYPVDSYVSARDRKAGTPVQRIGVQACVALYRAAAHGEAHCGCIVTVAGDAVEKPRNVWVPFGTMVKDLLAFCGLSEEPQAIILGDTMTGVAASSQEIPVLPGITCVLALAGQTVSVQSGVCIGCGRCAAACHMGLLPFEIVRRLENMHYERLTALHPEDCDGCNACSYTCPAARDVAIQVKEAANHLGTMLMTWESGDRNA